MKGRRKPLHLVVDGLPAHKTASVGKYVTSTNGKLTLHVLPGYAPDLNPDELVWSHVKRTGVARSPLRAGEKLELIDVRGQDERAIASIPGARAFDESIDDLPRDACIVLHCHKGGRSQQAAEQLRRRGFTNVHNLTGGIDAWSVEVDPTVPRY